MTDSAFRWQEILRAAPFPARSSPPILRRLAENIAGAVFLFPDDAHRIVELAQNNVLGVYPRIFAEVSRYLRTVDPRSRKPNFEDGVAARFLHSHASAQAALRKRKESGSKGQISCLFLSGGIQDNTINRLLLMSSSEHHLSSVPMAFFIGRSDKNV